MLPAELWIAVISHMSRNDLLRFRLCSSRTLLPMINQFLFETLYINSGVDEGRRAATRMLAVSRSTIAQHVRVLVLRVVCGGRYSGGYLLSCYSFPGITSRINIPITKRH